MTSCHRTTQGGVFTGLAIVSIGVLLLLARLGILHFHSAWRLWPAVFILVGLCKVFEARAVSQRIWGAMLTIIGALLLAHYFDHFRYGIDQLWPLFVIGGGLAMLFQNYFPPTRMRNGEHQ